MFYEVSREVFDKLPNAVFGAVAVKGIDNTKPAPALAELLEKYIAECEAYFAGEKPKNTQDVIPYREAFRALGINPGRYACSIEALMDRIAKGKGFPTISPAVDLGNCISIKYHLPIGAHDIDSFVDGGLSVRHATAEDVFIPFGGGEPDNPEEGEIVYASGNEVRTRRWTWRQGNNGMITESTSNLLYPIDGFSDVNMDKVKAAMDDFAAYVKEFFGDDVTVAMGIVDAENPRFEF